MSPPDDRLKAVFDRAAEIPDPTARAALLDRECAGDAALRERVEALLRAHDAAGSFLARAPDHPADPPTATWASPAARAGSVLGGRYKLLEAIGEGGMGSVWLAEQTEPVKRRVAVKLIKPGMDSKAVLARFDAERQALALMDHPNIAKVHDAGVTPDGRPFFVMELVKGVPITRYCDDRKLSVQSRLELFVQVCRAVQHAHQKGVIHRDLKPSNVLVAPYDGRPVVKVIDFGIAKAAGPALTEKTLFTGFGAVVGTPEYMSPEQAELNNQDIDTRSDVYALGVLLYELLTGTTPLTRQQVKEAALLEVLRLVREEEPPRPSTRLSTTAELPSIAAVRGVEPARLSRAVRGELDWIVMKALEKDRNRRYETATGLARDVERHLVGEPVLAVPPSAGYRLRKFARRNKAALTTAALVVAALLAGTAVSAWQAVRAGRAEGLATQRLADVTDERNRADAAAAEARAAAAEARAVNDFLTEDLLGQADPDKNPADKTVTVAELLRRAERRIGRNPRFAGQPATEATLHLAVGRTYFKLGLVTEADRHLRRAAALRREALGPDDPRTLAAQEALADFLNRALQRVDESEPLAKATWEARARVLGPDHADTLDSLDTYATALVIAGRKAEAADLHRRCLDALVRTRGREDEQTLTAMNNLSVDLNDMGRFPEAAALCREVFEIRRKNGPPSELVTSAYNLANSLHLAGDLAEADALVTEYADRAARELGPDNLAADRMAGLAVRVWADVGRPDDAVARGREVVARRRKVPGRSLYLGLALLDLGRALARQGKYAEAKTELDEAHEILRDRRQGQAFWAPWTGCWRGVCLAGLGDPRAEAVLLEAERGLREAGTTPARFRRTAVEHLIALYEKTGRPDQAAKWRAKLPADRPPAAPAAPAGGGPKP